jgi:hypothetical protein
MESSVFSLSVTFALFYDDQYDMAFTARFSRHDMQARKLTSLPGKGEGWRAEGMGAGMLSGSATRVEKNALNLHHVTLLKMIGKDTTCHRSRFFLSSAVRIPGGKKRVSPLMSGSE